MTMLSIYKVAEIIKLMQINSLAIIFTGLICFNPVHASADVCSVVEGNYLKGVSHKGISLESMPSEIFLNKESFEKNKNSYVPFENPNWLKGAQWINWRVVSVSGERYSLDRNYRLIAVSEKLPNNTRFLLSVGFMYAGWGESYLYEIYSVDEEFDLSNITDQKNIDELPNAYKVFPNESYSANTFGAFNLRNVFEFDDDYYLLGGSDWEDSKFNVIKIGHSSIEKKCEFSNYRDNKKTYEFLKIFDKMLHKISGCGYDKTCKGSIGDMNCWHSGYLTTILDHKQNSDFEFETDEEYLHYNDLKKDKVFQKFSNSDIWSKRFSNTFSILLPLAKKDLNRLLLDDGFTETKASEFSEIIISNALRQAIDGSGLYRLTNPIGEYDIEWLNRTIEHLRATDDAYNEGIVLEHKTGEYNSDFYSLALPFLINLDNEQLKSISMPNAFGKTLLMYAVQMNDFGAVKRLTNFYKKSDSIKDEDSCTNITLQGRTAMHYAAENASLELMKFLIRQGYPIMEKDAKGNDLAFYLQNNMYISDEDKKLGMKFFERLESQTKDIVVEPSFDCDKSSSEQEKSVCNNPTLANYDKSLSVLYARLKSHPRFNEIKQSQREWLKSIRKTCQATKPLDACLINQYRDRNYFLYKMLELIKDSRTS